MKCTPAIQYSKTLFASILFVTVATVLLGFTGCLDTASKLSFFHSTTIGDQKRVKSSFHEKHTAHFIAHQLRQAGYKPMLQLFDTATGELISQHPKRPQVHSRRTQSYNVIAEKKGYIYPDQIIILGAHFDSVPQNAGTGYSDNASGTGVVLGIAQALAQRDLPVTVRFVFFAAEESCPDYINFCVKRGLAGTGKLKGSSAYSSTLTPHDANSIVAMLNLDTVVGGDFLYAHGASEGNDGWVRERLLAIAGAIGIDLRINPGYQIPYANNNILYPKGTTGSWSDHFPFQQKGIEIGYIESTNWDIGDKDGYAQSAQLLNETGNGAIWHTDRDTLAFLQQTFPGRIWQQNSDVVQLVYQFLLDPQPASLSPGALARREAAICAEIIGKRIAGEKGEQALRDYILQRLWAMGYNADLQTFAIVDNTSNNDVRTSANVFAVKPGQDNRELVIGAHYDSVPQNNGNGYTDNCAGVGSNLALADQLRSETLPFTVRFIFFGAEEIGLLGSRAYVAAMDGNNTGNYNVPLGNLDNVVGMINLDTPWGGDTIYVHGASPDTQGWIREHLLAIADAKAYHFTQNPGHFISVEYWFGADAMVPQQTLCVTGINYAIRAAELGEPLTRDNFDNSELIDTSTGNTVVKKSDFCIFLPKGTTGDWSDHFPFHKEGKEIAYIEATNFSIADYDGYQQSKKLLEEFEHCLDNAEDPAMCGDAAGAIWHTDRDTFRFVNETFPGRVQRQSAQLMDVIMDFLRDPQIPAITVVPPSADAVAARSSTQRERKLRGSLRIQLNTLINDLNDTHGNTDLLIEALRQGNIEESALIKRIPPQAKRRLEDLREEFADLFDD